MCFSVYNACSPVHAQLNLHWLCGKQQNDINQFQNGFIGRALKPNSSKYVEYHEYIDFSLGFFLYIECNVGKPRNAIWGGEQQFTVNFVKMTNKKAKTKTDKGENSLLESPKAHWIVCMKETYLKSAGDKSLPAIQPSETHPFSNSQ